MSGTFPTSPAPQSIKVQSLEPTLVSVATNLRRQVRSRGGQRWLFTATFSPMNRANFDPIFAFSVAQRGQYETFNWTPATIGTTRGETSESPVVDGTASVGANSCSVDGLTASTSNILRKGDFIKFSGHSKIYMVTEDMTSDGSGDATLTFAPKLSTALANNETVTTSDVPFVVAFTSDIRQYQTGATTYYSYEVDLIEVP